jgi:hypothetical protein
MTRTILAGAAALLAAATLFASAAEACISCSYVPPVVHTPVYGAKPYHKPRVRTAVRKQRAAKRRIVESAPRVETVKTAKIAEPAPEIAPAGTAAVNENSSIAVAKTEAAQIETGKPAKSEPAKRTASAKVDCKKFFPSVGMTLTVPCE